MQTTINDPELKGKDAEPIERELIRAMKGTGVWGQPKAHRTRIFHMTADAEIGIIPQDGDHLLILVEQGVTVRIRDEGVGGTYAVDLHLKDGANVTYAATDDGRTHARRIARLERDAQLAWALFSEGKMIEEHVTTYLAGSGASATFHGCFLGKDAEEYDVRSSMIHAGDRSSSTMLTRAALTGESKGSSDGLIRIAKDAKGCDAYQRGEAVLLSKGARMRAQPNLEIGNEDVKCSHGVSLTRLDDEQLFYFKARGIGKRDATRLIVAGFFAAVIDRFPDADGLRARIAKRLEDAA